MIVTLFHDSCALPHHSRVLEDRLYRRVLLHPTGSAALETKGIIPEKCSCFPNSAILPGLRAAEAAAEGAPEPLSAVSAPPGPAALNRASLPLLYFASFAVGRSLQIAFTRVPSFPRFPAQKERQEGCFTDARNEWPRLATMWRQGLFLSLPSDGSLAGIFICYFHLRGYKRGKDFHSTPALSFFFPMHTPSCSPHTTHFGGSC